MRRRSLLVAACWLAVVAAAAPLALRQSDHLSGGGYDVGGSASARTEQIISSGVDPEFRPTALAGVMVAPRGSPIADYRRALTAFAGAVRGVKGVRLDPAVRSLALAAVHQHPGQPALIPLTVSADEFGAFDVARTVRARLALGDGGGHYGAVALHLTGAGAIWAGMLDQTAADLHHAELLAVPVLVVLLLAIFGSPLAAALPALLGAAAVTVTGALVYLVSRHTLVNAFVPNVTLMIGLGVAVDYALFVVVRYREELRAGSAPDAARRRAMATSGRAVVFSGLAVIVAVAALVLVDTAAVRSLAFGAIVVVAVSVLACTTLLPALLDLAGRRVGPGREPRPGLFARVAAGVQARPGRALLASLLAVGMLCAPLAWLKTGDGALAQLPRSNETRVGAEAAASVTGPGRGAPVKLLVDRAHIDSTVALLRDDPEVVKTGVRTQTRDHRWILILATPRHDGDSAQAKALVRRLRAQLPPGSLVGGDSAAQVDFDSELNGALPAVLLWILAATTLLLIVALRAPLLSLGAVLTNLLSVAAAFGVLTAVFVWGWLDGPLGLHSPGYVDTIAAPLVLAVVFGLSMDYQVFLLSRIRERRLAGAATAVAVREGVSSSARTITSAAVVMVAVFLTFVITGVPAVKEIGLGAAVAIALDATVVRLVLAPAAMTLAGERCWWQPRRGGRRPEPAVGGEAAVSAEPAIRA